MKNLICRFSHRFIFRFNATLILVGLILVGNILPMNQAGAWGRYDGGHHPAYGGAGWAHPRPVIVHNTYVNHTGGGCVGCGIGAAAVVGLVGGVIIGSTIAANNPPPPPPQTIIIQGPPMGTQVASLPPGCNSMSVNGAQYYQCGPYWYQPFFGGNGVYYTLVPTP